MLPMLSQKNQPQLPRAWGLWSPAAFTKISPHGLTEMEAWELCQENRDTFAEKLHQAWRHHSLATDRPLMPGVEPYRNYSPATYQLSAPLSLPRFTQVPKSESHQSGDGGAHTVLLHLQLC